jgi:hypothetical protein
MERVLSMAVALTRRVETIRDARAWSSKMASLRLRVSLACTRTLINDPDEA